MVSDAHQIQSDVQTLVLPPEVLEVIVSHLTDGLQMLETKTTSVIDWLGSFSQDELSDIPLEESSYEYNGQLHVQFDHFAENAIRVIPKNGLTSAETGSRIRTQQFQKQFQDLRDHSLSDHLTYLQDTKDQLLNADASVDDIIATIITERKAAIASITESLLQKWIELFTETRWYAIINGQFSCLAWMPEDGCRPPRLPSHSSTIEDTTDWVKLALECVFHIHKADEDGDILVFLAGKDEIQSAVKQVKAAKYRLQQHGQLMAFLLYKRLHRDLREAACEALSGTQPLSKGGRQLYKRKVVFATDIATTSEFVDGIRYVVDSGRTKRPRFDPIYGAIFLRPEAIAKDMLQSRQACSKRTEPGIFYHLYSHYDLQNLPANIPTDLETRRFTPTLADGFRTGNLFREILDMYRLKDSSPLVQHAIKELSDIGYLDSNRSITEYGVRLNKYPCDPSHAHFLECCRRRSCLRDGLKLVGMLSADEIYKYVPGKADLPSNLNEDSEDEAWSHRRRLFHCKGDHLTLLRIYKLYWEHHGDGMGQTQFCSDNQLSEKGLNTAIETYRRCSAAFAQTLKDSKNSTDSLLLECLVEAFPGQLAHFECGRRYVLDRMRHRVRFPKAVEIAHESALGRFSCVEGDQADFPEVILCGLIRWLRNGLYVFQASDVTSLAGSLPARTPREDDHKDARDV